MTERRLIASVNGTRIGELKEASGLWSFAYAPTWLDDRRGYPLSPHIGLQQEPHVDGASLRPVQWFFDNLLPEEGQRTLMAKDAKIADADAFGLLAYYGAESAGALTLLPPAAADSAAGGLQPLSDDMLSARIKALPQVSLARQASKRMSLAGAQHKLAVVVADGQVFEPIGSTASTHILKPDHPDQDYPHSVMNEWFSMRLAAAMGLQVPEVDRRYVPEPVYLIRRFDRTEVNGAWLRTHAIDACQLLNLDRSFKYARGGIESLAALAQMCRAPAVVRARLFNWLVFNVLVGNSDAHLKNLSFLVLPGGIELAPHYDLLSTALYDSRAYNKADWPDATTLAWPILGVERFSGLSFDGLVAAGEALGLRKATAERMIRLQRDSIFEIAEALYRDVEAAVVGSNVAGELRAVRAIIHAVIRQMVTQLG